MKKLSNNQLLYTALIIKLTEELYNNADSEMKEAYKEIKDAGGLDAYKEQQKQRKEETRQKYEEKIKEIRAANKAKKEGK